MQLCEGVECRVYGKSPSAWRRMRAEGGNFRHHNKGTVISKNSHIGMFVNQLCHDLSVGIDYPGEAFWAPLAMIRNFVRLHK